LAAVIVFSLILATFGGWQFSEGADRLVGVVTIAAFCVLLAFWGYLLYLKRGDDKPLADDTPLAHKSSPLGHRRRVLRRVLWNVCAIPITVIWGFMAIDGVRVLGVWGAIDATVMAIALLALFLHIWNRRLFSAQPWKLYAFAYLAWDLVFNIVIAPAVQGQPFVPSDLWGAALLVPLYVAVFRYAFRTWDPPESSRPSQGTMPVGAQPF
jgi:hypothetical protein